MRSPISIAASRSASSCAPLPATDYDSYSRLIARFMGKYIPGNPSMVVVNMTGGGGIIAANYMAQVAPRDGTVIGIVSQGLAADQALGMSPQLKANLREFGWIANVVYSNQLLVDLAHLGRPRRSRTRSSASPPSAPPARARRRCSIRRSTTVCSEPASRSSSAIAAAREIDLAMERGEVEGRGTNPYSSYMATHPTWIPQNKLIPLVQAGVEKEPELPNVPLILDLPVRPRTSRCCAFMARSSTVGRPLATTPGVPADRVAALRAAFEAVVQGSGLHRGGGQGEAGCAAAERATRSRRSSSGCSTRRPDMRERMKVALQPKDLHEHRTAARTKK